MQVKQQIFENANQEAESTQSLLSFHRALEICALILHCSRTETVQ